MRYLPLVCVLLVCGCIGSTSEAETECPVSTKPELVVCGRLAGESRDQCIVDAAVHSSKAPLCADVCMHNLRNLCYHKVAKKVGDVQICLNIKNDDWRLNDCISSATL